MDVADVLYQLRMEGLVKRTRVGADPYLYVVIDDGGPKVANCVGRVGSFSRHVELLFVQLRMLFRFLADNVRIALRFASGIVYVAAQ